MLIESCGCGLIGMNRQTLKKIVAIALALVGFAMVLYYLRMQTVTRTNEEDDWALLVFALGAAIAGAGISLPRLRPPYVVLVALVSPFVVFWVMVALYWGAIVSYVLLRTIFPQLFAR